MLQVAWAFVSRKSCLDVGSRREGAMRRVLTQIEAMKTKMKPWGTQFEGVGCVGIPTDLSGHVRP